MHATELLEAFAAAPGGLRARELHIRVVPGAQGEAGRARDP